MSPLVFLMTGVALLHVKTSGAAIARLDKVLVSELGAAVGEQHPVYLSSSHGEWSFWLKLLGVKELRATERRQGLPAERLKNAACGNDREDVGQIEDEGIDICDVTFGSEEVTCRVITGVCGV
jgi:hypothetical protein